LDRIASVGVVGGGSAGFLTALALRRKLPHLAVTVIRSEQVPIIGVGEATTWSVPAFLHDWLGIDRARFLREAHPTWKGGVRLFWGTRDHFDYTFEWQMLHRPDPARLPQIAAYYCQRDLRTPSVIRATLEQGRSPWLRGADGALQLAGPIGYHIENETFVGLLEQVAAEDGVVVQDRHITRFSRRADGGIDQLHYQDGGSARYDLYIDCSGFRSRLLGEELGVPFTSYATSLFCDRAIVGGYPRGDIPVLPYTGSHTMSAGWTFATEHWDRVNLGYVFSSSHLGDEEAEREFRAFCKGRVGKTRFVPYVSGRYERAWENNVVAVGNSSGFVEPLQSTGLHVICDLARFLVEALADSGCAPTPLYQRHFNALFAEEWDQIRRFLAMHYKLNRRLETPFWRDARETTDLAGGEEILEVWRECGAAGVFAGSLQAARGFFGWDGFLTLLVGMEAPTERPARPGETERQAFEALVQSAEGVAKAALPMQEALGALLGGARYRT
jgi:tryptophan halogenase